MKLDIRQLFASGVIEPMWLDTSLRARLFRTAAALGRICADCAFRIRLWWYMRRR